MKSLQLSSNAPLLVAVDFSPCSRTALNYAAALASHCQTKLVLLHVLQLYPFDYIARHAHPEQNRRLLAHAQTTLNCWSQGSMEAGAPAVETILRVGQPSKEILKAATQCAAQLVIMGTHGYCGLQPIVLGSTAQQVLRSAPCPVVLIPEPLKEFVWEDKGAARPSSSALNTLAV